MAMVATCEILRQEARCRVLKGCLSPVQGAELANVFRRHSTSAAVFIGTPTVLGLTAMAAMFALCRDAFGRVRLRIDIQAKALNTHL